MPHPLYSHNRPSFARTDLKNANGRQLSHGKLRRGPSQPQPATYEAHQAECRWRGRLSLYAMRTQCVAKACAISHLPHRHHAGHHARPPQAVAFALWPLQDHKPASPWKALGNMVGGAVRVVTQSVMRTKPKPVESNNERAARLAKAQLAQARSRANAKAAAEARARKAAEQAAAQAAAEASAQAAAQAAAQQAEPPAVLASPPQQAEPAFGDDGLQLPGVSPAGSGIGTGTPSLDTPADAPEGSGTAAAPLIGSLAIPVSRTGAEPKARTQQATNQAAAANWLRTMPDLVFYYHARARDDHPDMLSQRPAYRFEQLVHAALPGCCLYCDNPVSKPGCGDKSWLPAAGTTITFCSLIGQADVKVSVVCTMCSHEHTSMHRRT